MCVFSMVSDWGRDRWPQRAEPFDPTPTWPLVPTPTFIPAPLPSKEDWEEFKKLLDRAREYDKKNQESDCPDPEKVKWMQEVERRLVELEGTKAEQPLQAN